MTQRARVKLFCAAVCVLVALLCALNQAPILAIAHGVAAVVVWRVGYGGKVESADVDAFINGLRDVRHGDGNREKMVRATLLPHVIAAPIVPSQEHTSTAASLVFRDELSVAQWRALSIRLRHQPRTVQRPHANG